MTEPSTDAITGAAARDGGGGGGIEEPLDQPGISGPPWMGYAAVAAAVVLLIVAVLRGQQLQRLGHRIEMLASPFTATWGALWSPWLLVAAALAVLLVWWWVPATEQMRWPRVLAGAGLWGLVWPVVLQLSSGWDSLYEILGDDRAYLPVAQSITSPAEFLSTFVDRIHDFPTHTAAHPPGAVLSHWIFDEIGGGRSDVLTAAFLLIAASAAPAALVAMDRIAGRAATRRAAPFVGLAPAAIWIASSPDAMFMGVVAWAVMFGAVAITTSGNASRAAAVGSGLFAGASFSLSYGMSLLLAPLWALVVLAVLRKRFEPLVWATLGLAVVPVLFMLAGFNWWDGANATREHYQAGVASRRPLSYFVFANVAVLAATAGPAAVAGIARLRHRASWWLVGGALVGVAAANFSGLSKGEVERIWLPAIPFLLLACTAFVSRGERRAWLGLQLAVGIAMQFWIRSPW